jgi:two-component system sensor histidine kinase UhpB
LAIAPDAVSPVAGVEWLLEWASGQTEVATRLQLDGVDETERFEPDVEFTLFRVTQEAINNVLKHARATRLSASLSRAGGGLVLHVEDDGVGLPANGQRKKGLGLSGMREREVQLYGTFEIGSTPKGGTRVTAIVPLQNPVAVEEAR